MVLESKKKNKKDVIRTALHGLKNAFQREFSLHLILGSMVICIGLGCFFQISLVEWSFTILLLGLMMAIELMNSSIEAVVDLVSPAIHPLAKIAKDTASAAEAVFASISFVSFCLIFIPKIVDYIMW